MFATDAEQKTLLLALNYNDVHFGQSDKNYFYNPYYPRHVFVSRYDPSKNRWIRENLILNQWRALSGYDGDSKEFSYLGQFDDITIDRQTKSRIIYNTSLGVVSIDLELEKYCDVQGNKMSDTVTLQPFESKILIRADY